MLFSRKHPQISWNEILILFITTVLVVGIGAAIAFKYQKPPENPVTTIQQHIEEANYCETTADCQLVNSQCPFGCYVAVNKNRAASIEQEIMGYQSTCIYSCIRMEGIECRNNKCEVLVEQP